MNLSIIMLVGLGSAAGGICRYILGVLIHTRTQTGWPLGTLAVNLIGSFLIGLVMGGLYKLNGSGQWQGLLVTGFLGGFTTFSAFAFETVILIRNGHFGMALVYIAISLLFGILLTGLGILLAR